MKKLYFFASLACSCMFAACSSDVSDFVAENASQDGKMVVGMDIAGDNDTRVAFGNNNIQNLVWANGDQLQAVGYDTEGYVNGKGVFSLTEGAGGSIAKFAGDPILNWEGNNSVSYRFTYVGKNVTYNYDTTYALETVDCKYLEQTATNVSDFDHIKNHLYMGSPLLEANGTNIKSGVLHHKNSILRVNLLTLPDAFYGLSDYTLKFFVNYTEGAEPIAQLKFNKWVAPGYNDYVYLAFDPENDLIAGNKIAFEISAANKVYMVSAVSTNGKYYEPGKIYTVSLDSAKPGSWTWNSVAKKGTAFHTSLVENMVGWTSSIEGGTTKMWYWNGRKNCLQGATGRVAKTNADITGYATSDAIRLLKSNVVTFEQDFPATVADPTNLEFLVRISGTEAWTSLDFTRSSGTVTIKLDPATYDDKTVEFAFKGFRAAGAAQYNWKVWNFNVAGE